MKLLEILSRTRLQVFSFPKDGSKNMPTGAGCGFFLKYRNKHVFVTADHVIHPIDHTKKMRLSDGYDIVIVNNVVEKDANGVSIPICTPIGNLYYFEQARVVGNKEVDLTKLFFGAQPFDVSFSFLGEDRFTKPFKNEGFRLQDGTIIPGGMNMMPIPSERIVEPEASKSYIVWGNVKYRINPIDNKTLLWEPIIHEDLEYLGEAGDYYCFHPSKQINPGEWHGISGGPFFDTEGNLIGILCGGNTNNNIIYVLKMSRVLTLIDTTLKIEEIENQSNK